MRRQIPQVDRWIQVEARLRSEQGRYDQDRSDQDNADLSHSSQHEYDLSACLVATRR